MSGLQIKRRTGGEPSTHSQSRIENQSSSTGRHTEPASAVAPSAFSFEATMEATELEDLLDQLYELSDKLSVFPGGRLIEEYRSVLHELLKRAAQGMRIKRDMRWRKTDRKMYITIERAEKAMDELEEAFIYEGNRTKALSILEEIKGCLISLLM
ncbi:MAG: DUF327 family protein [Synergistaceae bacterium]|nr:DUF327 family protein [Synergistaceae bacterium]MBQ7068181.1 DUF327 family protein [Synergistaceae bacterium]MBR0075397.1 DUF327 family protein [Synergistaceae bacterium]MBR0251903.1 DUF327 family protein [Synergistaceae bacterium]